LDEDVQALLDQQRRIKDDQPEAQWEHIIARPHLQESSNRTLYTQHRASNHPILKGKKPNRYSFPRQETSQRSTQVIVYHDLAAAATALPRQGA